jgi:hypothetical protein
MGSTDAGGARPLQAVSPMRLKNAGSLAMLMSIPVAPCRSTRMSAMGRLLQVATEQ